MAIKSVELIMEGTSYPLTYSQSTGQYTATITAPTTTSYNLDGHFYPLQIKAIDDAGNETIIDTTHQTLGEDLRLFVKEITAPTYEILSPSDGSKISTSAPTISFKVLDSGSGVDPSSVVIMLDNTAVPVDAINAEAIDGGYTFSYAASGLVDGSHSVEIMAADYDGNKINGGTNVKWSFTVDITAPVLSVTAPAVGLTQNSATIEYAGTTNDLTTSPVTLTLALNNGAPQELEVSADGAFSGSVNVTEDGDHTLKFVARDQVGNETEVIRTVTVNRSAPVISAVTITPNPVNVGATFIITVTVTDA